MSRPTSQPAATSPPVTLPAHPVGDIFGLGAFVTQRSLSDASPLIHRARLSGSHWVREELTATRLHAGPDGAYWWGPYDHVVDLERGAGLQVLGLLDYSNTWGYGDHGTMPHEDIDRLSSDFSRYAYVVARHFRGRIQYWQLWNEPNLSIYWHPAPSPDDYALLLDAAYRAIKQANPQAKVVLAGTNGVDLPFLRAVAARTGSFDVVAVHPYRGEPEDNLLPQIRALQVFRKPVWFSEIGWPAGDGCDPCPNEDEQARYLVRFYALGAAAEVQRIFWYDFRDDNHSPSPRELHFGLLRRDLTPKPAFAAYAFLAHTLQGATFVRAERLGADGIYALRFERKEAPLAIMWNTGTTEQDVVIPWPGRSAVALDVDGNVLGRVPVSHGALTWSLQPGGEPVYILERVPAYRVPHLQALPSWRTIVAGRPHANRPKPTRHQQAKRKTRIMHGKASVTAPQRKHRTRRHPQAPHDTSHPKPREVGSTSASIPVEHVLPPITTPITEGPSPTPTASATGTPTIEAPFPTPTPSPTAAPTPSP